MCHITLQISKAIHNFKATVSKCHTSGGIHQESRNTSQITPQPINGYHRLQCPTAPIYTQTLTMTLCSQTLSVWLSNLPSILFTYLLFKFFLYLEYLFYISLCFPDHTTAYKCGYRRLQYPTAPIYIYSTSHFASWFLYFGFCLELFADCLTSCLVLFEFGSVCQF